jgi:hypothetical protein
MFARFKVLIIAIAATLSFLMMAHQPHARTRGSVGEGTCDGGECTFTPGRPSKAVKEICETSLPTVFWDRNTPLYLVQCDCDCSLQQNTNWVIDKVHNKIYGLSYGRYLKKSFMEIATTATEVPDRLTSVKLCEAPKPKLIKSSAFVLLNKLPSDEPSPYCYEITYIIFSDNDLTLFNNEGIISNNNDNYWIKNINARTRSSLLSLIDSIK